MKKHLIILLSALIIMVSGCKSKKQVTAQEELTTWQNVSMPVTMTVSDPMSLTLSGTLTMVRGEYALVSFRTFGFEVAQAYATPEEMNLVLKMPSKIWVNEALGDRLSSKGVDFTKLQDEIIKDNIPAMNVSGLSVSSSNGVNTLSVSTTANGIKLSATLSLNLNDAKWNVSNPASFTTPGSEYRKLSLASAAKTLGK